MKRTLNMLSVVALSLMISSGMTMSGCGKSSSDDTITAKITATATDTDTDTSSTTNTDTKTTPGPEAKQITYEGTVYMATEGGGHVAIYKLSIDPTNTKAPISLAGAPKSVQLEPGTGMAYLDLFKTGGGGNIDHNFHDVRLDIKANRLYYSSILAGPLALANPGGPVHLGYVDLNDNSVHDSIIESDQTRRGSSFLVYCGSGQTATHFLPVTMSHPAYIDAIAKSDINGGAEAIFGTAESLTAAAQPITNNPAVTQVLSAVNGLLMGPKGGMPNGLQLIPGLNNLPYFYNLPVVGSLLGGENGILSGIGGLPIGLLGGTSSGLLSSVPLVGGILGGATGSGGLLGSLPVVGSLVGNLGGLPVVGSLFGGNTGTSLQGLLGPAMGVLSPLGFVTDYKRTFVEQFRGNGDYFFAHGSSSPDDKYMYVAVCETTAGGGGQGANMTGTFRGYLLRMADFITGTVTQGSVVATGAVTGSAGHTIAFRSNFTPDGSRILQGAGDRFVVIDAKTMKALNGAGGDTNIGGSKKGIIGVSMFDADTGVENHDAMSTADGKYAVLVVRYHDKTGDGDSTGLQLYDLTTMKQVGDPTNVCGVCHAPSMRDANGWYIARGGCGIDGVLAPVEGSASSGDGGPDGTALYNASCAGCHGDIATTGKKGATSERIKTAIENNVGNMGGINLSDAEIDAIAAALSGSSTAGGNTNSGANTNTNAGSNTTTNTNTSSSTSKTLASITVDPDGWTRNPGDTVPFTATGKYSDNSTKDITASVTWKSSDTTRVTIDSSGGATVVDGAAEGSVTITATSGSVSGEATLTVAAASSKY